MWRSLPLACAAIALAAVLTAIPALCATAGPPGSNALLIADRGKSDAVIALSPQAGRFERQAAEDLAKYIKVMAGAFVPISSTSDVSEADFSNGRPLLVIGSDQPPETGPGRMLVHG